MHMKLFCLVPDSLLSVVIQMFLDDKVSSFILA